MSNGKYSQILHEYLISIYSQKNCLKNSLSGLLCIFHLKHLPGKQSHSEIYSYSLYIFHIKIRYSWMLWKIFVNRNNICKINIFAIRNNIYNMKLWRIGVGIYLWPKYQHIYSWRIYSQTIRELFTNIELFAENCPPPPPSPLNSAPDLPHITNTHPSRGTKKPDIVQCSVFTME